MICNGWFTEDIDEPDTDANKLRHKYLYQKYNTLRKLSELIKEKMDAAEEEALKGLMTIVHRPSIRRFFTPKEISEYSEFIASSDIELYPSQVQYLKKKYGSSLSPEFYDKYE